MTILVLNWLGVRCLEHRTKLPAYQVGVEPEAGGRPPTNQPAFLQVAHIHHS